MAKLLKLRRGTTTQHSNFTGAEGECTVDMDKDVLVVHDGQTAGGHPVAAEDMANVSSASIAGRLSDDSIATSKIGAGALPTDVTVTNANLVSNAAIAGTKISPDFGSQNIATTGDISAGGDMSISGGNLRIYGAQPGVHFTDTDNNDDFLIYNNNGILKIYDATDGADRFSVNSSGVVNVNGNLDVGAGIDVTGNITVSGTVDGVDIAALNTTVGNLSLSGSVLANGTTATTQSAGDNSTKVATTAYTDTAISNLVDSSPAALNTLNELASALNDDPNFATTVNNNIAAKMPTGGGTFVGDVTFDSATAGRDITFDRSHDKLKFADNAVAAFGDSSDLQIYHDGSDTYIDEGGTGGLYIKSSYLGLRSSGGEILANFAEDGAVELYHDNSNKKFETTSTGVSVTGALVASGDVTAFSDQTLKKDITTINDALGLCGKLRGVSYKWIKDDKPSIGVIAQEIEQHIPEIVSTTQLDGKDVKSVDYGKIVGVLINAVNELKAELDEYKATKEN